MNEKRLSALRIVADELAKRASGRWWAGDSLLWSKPEGGVSPQEGFFHLGPRGTVDLYDLINSETRERNSYGD
jgi:hypothetical protein